MRVRMATSDLPLPEIALPMLEGYNDAAVMVSPLGFTVGDTPMRRKFSTSCSTALLAVLWLCCDCSTGFCAEDSLAPIAPDVIEAWQQAGAKAGWMWLNPLGSVTFTTNLKDAQRNLEKSKERISADMTGLKPIPAFQITDGKEIGLEKLPIPAVPFGLAVHTPATDDGFKAIEGLDHLIALKVEGRSVDDKLLPLTAHHLQSISKVKHLKVLDLERCFPRYERIAEGILRELVPLKNLEYLSLMGNPVIDEDLTPIGELKDLRGLNLRFTEVGGPGLNEIASLEKLEYLSIWRSTTEATPEPLESVAKLKALRCLILVKMNLSDTALLEIAKLKNLERLEVRTGSWTIGDFGDEGIIHLAKNHKLKLIAMRGGKYTAEGVAKLQASLPECRLYIRR